VASFALDADVLIPEGVEDMWLTSSEGSPPRFVQVKSRMRHLDRFPVGEASGHVLDLWEKHLKRPQNGSVLLVVVFERGIEGEENLSDFDKPLAEALSPDSSFRSDLRSKAVKRQMDHATVSDLLSSTVVVGMSWDEVTAGTTAQIEARVPLPPSGLDLVVHHLRIVIADAADVNANDDPEQSCSLTRTDIVDAIDTAAGQIDLDSLHFAQSHGICEPFTLTQPVGSDDRFYEGIATQPGHVVAGLVVPRPAVMDMVLDGLGDRSAVVITGPSGVGKSAVLWTVPLALPGVVWYRVRRLLPKDAQHLIHLARAYKAAPHRPVGFLVDAAGTEDFNGWHRLRSEAAAIPGVLLVATARIEDLFVLGDLSGCSTVTVELNHAAAETIFKGLRRRGATTEPHWVEAFNQSNGLTLEFTHLLTRGKRLHEVIGEQVKRRIREKRCGELDVLRLVSVADRWSASLSTSDVVSACRSTKWETRRTVERLADEHLLVEQDGTMSGLHQLRSSAISEVIHSLPPPDLHGTIKETLRLVPDHQLHRFITNLLRDEPSAKNTVIEAAVSETSQLSRLTAYLHGLCLSDFYQVAKTWEKIAQDHVIPVSLRPLLFSQKAVGMQSGDFLMAITESAHT